MNNKDTCILYIKFDDKTFIAIFVISLRVATIKRILPLKYYYSTLEGRSEPIY